MDVSKYNQIAEKLKPQKQVKKHCISAFVYVLIAAILTGLGIYDRIGKRAGAGTFIPITGFSNSMTSSALEAKSEGLVTGIGANIFKLGGTVITFGIVASFVLGGIRYVFSFIW